ncbi:MAG TPA: SUMF1/EgtB/PvdO family nonheme iron enzyme [Polyangiaceae bacterium]
MSQAKRRKQGSRGKRGLAVIALVAAVVGGALALARRERPAPSSAPSAGTGAPGARAARDAGADALPLDAAAPDAAVDAAPPYIELDGGTLAEKNEALIVNMKNALALDDTAVAAVRAVFAASEYIGQGNPKATQHPMTRAECRERRAQAPRLAAPDPRCGAANMVPLYDPAANETPAVSKTCIDQFEFPNIACEYPVVWVRANEAQALCHALGKRLCDAHEWEGGCAGALKSPESEYPFDPRRIQMAYDHNKDREIVWSYGKEQNQALCATGSRKSPKCLTPSWSGCGSNDYPAGAFPACVSPLGVYDLHGNAAEHMNFPRKLEELGSRGGSGETEMKGSWFIFLRETAHLDDCRWRAPDWHVSRIDDPNSHRNYHLGFRCCKDLR